MKEETKNIDECECVYCGYIFDGKDATNGDMDTTIIECPKCKREMAVYMSIEYMCMPVKG